MFTRCVVQLINLMLLVSTSASLARAQFIQQGTVLPLAAFDPSYGNGLPSTAALSGDGNTAIVGGWVFIRTNGDWSQQTQLAGAGPAALSGDGNTALVGSTVYVRANGIWSTQTQLVNAPAFSSVALSGDGNTAIVGQVGYFSGHSPNPGDVKIFARSGVTWIEQAAGIFASSPVTGITYRVGLSGDGNIAIISVLQPFGNNPVTIWSRKNGAWSQTFTFPVLPNGPNYGVLSGDGATALLSDGSNSATYAFANGTWTPQGGSLPAVSGSLLGLSSDGNTAIVDSPADNNNAGAASLFTRSNGVWSQLGGKLAGQIPYQISIPNEAALSADGNTAIFATPTYALFYTRLRPFITSQNLGPVRNNFTGWVGGQFTTGAASMEITSLGRLFAPGNTGTHAVKLVRASDGSDVPGGSVNVSMAGGSQGQYRYAPLSNPVLLPAQTSYYLASQETSGGDQWYDYSMVSTTVDGVLNVPVYLNGGKWIALSAPSYEYVPVNFLYGVQGHSALLPEAFITAPTGFSAIDTYGLSTLPVSVTAIPATGLTIKSVQLAVDGVNQGAPLTAAPYNFQLDLTKIKTPDIQVGGQPGGHILTAVVTDSANATGISPPQLISISFPPPITVTISAPAANSTVSGNNVTVSAAVSPGTGITVTSVQFQVDGANLGAAVTAPPYNVAWDTTTVNNGAHSLTAIAKDSAGDTITSAAVGVTVNNVYVQPSGNPLIQSFTPGRVRNDGAWVGTEFTVGPAPITVTALGRIFLTGNSQTHIVKLVQANNSLDVPGSTVAITMSGGTPMQFLYIPLAHPLTLAANTSYYVVSQENGGDQWYDSGPVTLANVAKSPQPVYFDGYKWVAVPLPGFSYIVAGLLYTSASSAPPTVTFTAPAPGAVVSGNALAVTVNAQAAPGLSIANIQYQVDGTAFTPPLDTTKLSNGMHTLIAIATDSAGNTAFSAPLTINVQNTIPAQGTPFLTGQTPGSLRNNFTGFVGMQFTTGSTALVVSALGRLYIAGNNQAHLLELVRASDGTVVASAFLSFPGTSPGQYQYMALNAPVTLAANTSYYAVSQETAGGDQWYDYEPVTAGAAGTVNGPVYSASPGWAPLGVPGYSYVPVNFLYYTQGSVLTPTVTLTQPAPNAVVSGSITLAATATAPTGRSIASVQFYVDFAMVGAPVTGPGPYSLLFDTTTLSNQGHSVSVVATDSAGFTGTSASMITVLNGPPANAIPFVTAQSLGTLRNNFSGFVGMEFTVGNRPMNVNNLGRFCAPGNSGSHLLKLVSFTGVDVPNGSVTVSGPCTPGSYQYQYLQPQVILQPNTSYYLVSQEQAGGDQWYDFGPVATTPAALVNGAVYSGSGAYNLVAGPNYSYGPLNLLYY